MSLAVSLKDVSRTYGDRFALRHVTLDVTEGEGVLLTGHNGSGKTTLLRILATLLAPSSGEITLLGKPFDRAKFELRRSIGALFMNGFLHDDLTVEENLLFYARLYGIKNDRAVVLQRLEALNMRRFLYERVGHLSRGERQKIALIRTLLHEPTLLLLDEPTTGLDQSSTEFLSMTLRNLRGKTTIVCATHQPGLLSGFADREVNLKEGRTP